MMEEKNMVNANKVTKKLPSLLTGEGTDPKTNWNDYKKKSRQIDKLKHHRPSVYNSIVSNIMVSLDELDRAAEQVGFAHVDFDEKGNIITRQRKR